MDFAVPIPHQSERASFQRLVRQMGLRALYPKPRTSQPGVGHTVYPYRLRGLSIERPNQVWATDICYIPMAHGFMYLVAIMDWYSRRVLAWRVSNTFDSDFCVEALEAALTRYGPPEIFNTDQGAQFTSTAFTTVLKAHAVAISMDGKGRWVDKRVRRAALAQRQIRGCVSPCVRHPRRAPRRADRLFSVLQRATAA